MNIKYLTSLVFFLAIGTQKAAEENSFSADYDQFGIRAYVNGQEPWQPGEREAYEAQEKARQASFAIKKTLSQEEDDNGCDQWGMRALIEGED